MPTYLFLRRLRRSPAAFSGLTLVILLVLTALFAPWLAPHDPNWQDAAARLQGPGAGHWLGTDSYGRDLLSRLLYGARPALGLVALVTAITLPVGLLVGILSGYYGGWLERILMRFTDVVMSMPRLILAFAFVAMLGPGLVNGALALALTTGRPTPVRRAAKFSACAIATTSPRRRCWAFAAGGCWSAIFCRCVCRRRLSGWRSIWRALSSPPPGSAFSALAPARRWRSGER